MKTKNNLITNFDTFIKQKLNYLSMNKKVITGALIALAAGIAVLLYKRNKNKIDEIAASEYDKLNGGINYAEEQSNGIFS